MKKSERMGRDVGSSVATGVETAVVWATPRVEAAVHWAVPRIEKSIETASPKIQEGLHRAAHELAEGVTWATPRLQEGLEKVAPRISHAVDAATPKIQHVLEQATPKIEHARDVVVKEYLPAASLKLGEAAEFTARKLESVDVPAPVQKAVAAVTHDKKAAKRAQKAAAAAAATAAARLKKNAKPAKSHKGLLIFGIIAAASVAGVAAWKASKPIEDPWKSPAPAEPSPVPSSVAAPETEATTEEVKSVISGATPPPVSAVAGEARETPVAVADAHEATDAVPADARTVDVEGLGTDTSSLPKPGPRAEARRRASEGEV